MRKGTGGEDGYSGFCVRDPESGATGRTELHGILELHGIERVVVIGLALDVCVKETALDARRLGYTTAVVTYVSRRSRLVQSRPRLAFCLEAGGGVVGRCVWKDGVRDYTFEPETARLRARRALELVPDSWFQLPGPESRQLKQCERLVTPLGNWAEAALTLAHKHDTEVRIQALALNPFVPLIGLWFSF